MRHLIIALALAAAKKKEKACPPDSDKFKIHATDVTCATIRGETARQQNGEGGERKVTAQDLFGMAEAKGEEMHRKLVDMSKDDVPHRMQGNYRATKFIQP